MMLRLCCMFALFACFFLCGCLGPPSNNFSPQEVVRLYYQKLDNAEVIKKVRVVNYGRDAFILDSCYRDIPTDTLDWERLIFTRDRTFLDLDIGNLRTSSL